MQDYNTEHPFDLTLSEEQQMTWDMLRKFAETELRPHARQVESDGRPSDELLEKIKSLDLISLIIPEAYGGMGLEQDSVSNALALEALAYGDLSLAMSVSIPLLTAQIISEHGSEEQKAELLPELISGSIFHVGLGINNALLATDPYQSSVIADESGEEIILNGSKTGVAFDEPISNRQSVAFMIADMAIETEALRLMVYKSSALKDLGEDFHKQASLTYRFAAHHGMKIGTDGVQLLGGHGFTHEHPVELWYRNLRAIGIFEGGAGV